MTKLVIEKQSKLIILNAQQQKEFDKLTNKSQKIRYLRFLQKFDRSSISNLLGIRYQFVRNIEIVSTEKDLEVVKNLIK